MFAGTQSKPMLKRDAMTTCSLKGFEVHLPCMDSWPLLLRSFGSPGMSMSYVINHKCLRSEALGLRSMKSFSPEGGRQELRGGRHPVVPETRLPWVRVSAGSRQPQFKSPNRTGNGTLSLRNPCRRNRKPSRPTTLNPFTPAPEQLVRVRAPKP